MKKSLRSWLWRVTVDQEVTDEIALHIELRTRELIRGGMLDKKILRVVGLSDSIHLERKDPFNPINRRISIIVMNKATEEAIMRDGAQPEVPAEVVAAHAAQAAPAPAPAAAGGK